MTVPPHIRYATEADVPALCKVNILSFHKRRFFAAMFPEADVNALANFQEFNAMKHMADPHVHMLTVDDPANSEIHIAYGRWMIPDTLGFHQSVCDLSEKGAEMAATAISNPLLYAPQPRNEALFVAFKNMLAEARKKHTTDRDMGKFCNAVFTQEGAATDHLGSSGYVGHLALAPRAWDRVCAVEMGHGKGRRMADAYLP